MYSTHMLCSQSASPPTRTATPNRTNQESEKKPRKVNSEIRKQQNRIASRNYREKRKRKLQYLQQLIKDGGPTDDQQPEVTEQQHCQRILTPEYYTPETIAKNMTIPPNDNYSALSSSSDGTIGSSIATTATTYQTQFQPTAPSYPPYDPTWNAPMYEIPAPINIWNVPTWIPNIEFSPPMTTRSADDFDFTPPPHSHDDFHQLPTPPRQMHTPEPDFFVMGSYAAQYRRQHEQSMGMSSMSLPSSPFCYPRYPGPS